MRVIYTAKTGNKKLGPMPAVYTSRRTCPTACPLKRNGCYAEGFPTSLHWDRLGRKESRYPGIMTWEKMCNKISSLAKGTLWRFAVAGDLPGASNSIDANKLIDLVFANTGTRGWTYTHKPVIRDRPEYLAGTGIEDRDLVLNRSAIRYSNRRGFTINLSGNNLSHADELSELKIGPVVVLLPKSLARRWTGKTPAGRKVITCPATYSDVTCDKCKLCAIPDREVIIGFPAHGNGYRKAELVQLEA